MEMHKKKTFESATKRPQTMPTSEIASDWRQISFIIYGFDRPCFINDIAECIPQGDACQIIRLCVDANGIEARGQLILRITQRLLSASIVNRLKAVPGMVCIQPAQI